MKYHNRASRIMSILLAVAIVFVSIVQPVVVKAEVSAPTNLKAHHAYSVIDARTGEVLLGDNADKRVYPASTAKMMTAIVILEKTKSNKVIKVTKNMLKQVPSGCSNYGIKVGERYTVETLLNMLLICSAADAAICLSIGVFGSVDKCVAEMNKKCKTLGLSRTTFDNPIGLDIGNGYKNNYTTANDLAQIARCAMSNNTIKQIVAKKTYQVRQSNGKKGRLIKSTNRFYSDVVYSKNMYTIIGTKSGTTSAAGAVFAATAIDKSGREVICVYMGKDSHTSTFTDIRKLLDSVYKAQSTGEVILSQGRQMISVLDEEYEVVFGQTDNFLLDVNVIDEDTSYELGKNAGKITYVSSDEEVASVDSKGNVIIHSVGSAQITIKVAKTAYHKEASETVTVNSRAIDIPN